MSKNKINMISIISLFILILNIVIYFQNRIKNIESNFSQDVGETISDTNQSNSKPQNSLTINSIVDSYVEDMYEKSINVIFSPYDWGSRVGISISDDTEKISSEKLNNALGWDKNAVADVREIYNYHECIDNNFSKKFKIDF